EKLQLNAMTNDNTDPYESAYTISIDHATTTTGISACERAKTIIEMTKPTTSPGDFKRPGHVFPLVARPGGVLKRPGHTEASVDLAILSNAFPSATICEIVKEDGDMARVPDLFEMSKQFDLSIITIKALQEFRYLYETQITREVETTLPTTYGSFNVIGYTNLLDEKEHIAFIKGNVQKSSPVLVRIHSECLTGDVFGSHRCDCGPQLHTA